MSIQNTDIFEKANIIKILKEDVLRILCESKKQVSREAIEKKIKASRSFISKAVEGLENEQLVQTANFSFDLTMKGRKKAKAILNKHLFCEDYFK